MKTHTIALLLATPAAALEGGAAVPLQDGGGFEVTSPWMIYEVWEGGAAGRDLNGDGDAEDAVAFVYHAETGDVTNLGVAMLGGTLVVDEGLMAFLASEPDEGRDLNGDGDFLDRVLHLHVGATGATHNTGHAVALTVSPDDISLVGRRVAFRASEPDQGADLNGDGDQMDRVSMAFDSDTGELFNTGLASARPYLQGRYIALSVLESAQGGTDLNGDGDTLDQVGQIYDLETRSIVASLGASAIVGAGPRLIAYHTLEASEGQDANGDGDALDNVVGLFDLQSMTATSTGLAALGAPASTLGSPPLKIPADAFLFNVHELGQGADLNSDGDLGDVVWHYYDAASQSVHNTQLTLPTITPYDFTYEENYAVAYVLETSDLNGDGDTLDIVPQVLDLQAKVIRSSGFATFSARTSPAWLAATVMESAQGAQDLNGDGDSLDRVLHVFEAASGQAWNLGRVAAEHRITAAGLVFISPRLDFGWEQPSKLVWGRPGALHELPLPEGSTEGPLRADGVLAAIRLIEAGMGQDLNGDGDTEDRVIVALPLR